MRMVLTARLIGLLAFLTAVSLIVGSSFSASSADNSLTAAAVEITEATDDALSFTLSLPSATVSPDGVVQLDGLDGRFAESGLPDLPYYSTMIALPPEADASVSVELIGESEELVATVRPIPAAQLDQADDILAVKSIESFGLDYSKNAEIYAADALFPAVAYELSEPMYVRDLRVVELTIFPLRYNPAQQTMVVATSANVTVEFSGGIRASNPATGDNNFTGNVLNADQAEDWRSLPSDLNTRAADFPIGKQTFKIEVSEDGIYELTYAALQSAGMPVTTVNPNSFEMMNQGEAVAYEFVGDADE